jgi:FAD/FMN-containing dehydrogenase/Fe-S oxidoreductase
MSQPDAAADPPAPGRPLDRYDPAVLRQLEHDLRRSVRGPVRFDLTSRLLFATDASFYHILPAGVFQPRDADDVASAVACCARLGVSVVPRGGGTALGGQTVGPGLQIDFARFMNNVLAVDAAALTARVQPGVVLDELNRALKSRGLQFAPDVATSSRATIGGMMGSNSCGTHSVIYGRTVDHVMSIDVVLADGSRASFAPVDDAERARRAYRPGLEGQIYRETRAVVDDLRDEIKARYPDVMRSNAGYGLDRLSRPPFNLAALVVGSEGTLCTVVEATLKLTPLPGASALLVAHFDSLSDALKVAHAVLPLKPAAVELLDASILSHVKDVPALRERGGFIRGDPRAIVVIEVYGDKGGDLAPQLDAFEARLREARLGTAYVRCLSPREQSDVWEVRKQGLGLLMSVKTEPKPVEFIEDTCVPTEHLHEYITQLLETMDRMGVHAGCYAHASVGVIHLRPFLNIHTREGIDKMRDLARVAFDLVRKYGGAFAGEHGDGIVRSSFIAPFYGQRITEGFRRVKKAFDPAGIMNPGKIIDPYDMFQNMRFDPPYHEPHIDTMFDFKPWGGIMGHVEMCGGVGHCRKRFTGVMCPSYMATIDEKESTRGRANALRAALAGLLDQGWLESPEVAEVMDLCLACKACKAECPTGVDMARLKAEYQYQKGKKWGFSLGARLVGAVPMVGRIGCAFSPVSNWVARSLPGRQLSGLFFGLDTRYMPPPFARKTFRSLWRSRARRKAPAVRGRVVLWDDTWIDYFNPETGLAAADVLEACGYEVVLPNKVCCGRPMISKGLLDAARRNALRNVAALEGFAREGLPILFTEPSCYSAIKEEYLDLAPGESSRRVAASAMLIDEFLAAAAERNEIPWAKDRSAPAIVFHGHCHQKSTVGVGPARRLLAAMPGSFKELDTGCCGMAGAFGSEKGRYDVAKLVGEDRLFPAVRAAGANDQVVVCGFSCRHHIEHHTGRKPVHLIEAVRERLKNGG